MKFLFIHQNYPGQFKHLVNAISEMRSHQVVAIVENKNIDVAKASLPPSVVLLSYPSPKSVSKEGHPYLYNYEAAIKRGQQVAKLSLELKEKGYVPDVICVHTGWGEALFLKEIFPDAKIIGYFEFFYRAEGADVGFDMEFYQHTLDDIFKIKIRNSHHLLSYECCDLGVTPTTWQTKQLPSAYQYKMDIIHEGVDTDLVKPNSEAIFTVNENLALTSKDSVITFVNRNLEPYRGFHSFMRSLPSILKACPNTHVVIVGGDEVSYGRMPSNGGTWRQVLMKEVGSQLDIARVHFVGNISYERYLSLLQISTTHVYLTYPFVLSWSMLEAMSTGCVVIGSNTSPVTEVITDKENGVLVDFFDYELIAKAIINVVRHPDKYKEIRNNARRTIIEKYDLKRVCLPAWLQKVGLSHQATLG